MDTIKTVCAWCNVVLKDGPAEPVSHGICEPCEKKHFPDESTASAAPVITCISDGGRAQSSFPKEKLDCTVRAWAILHGIPYDTAHKILSVIRRDGRKAYGFEMWARRFRAVQGVTVREMRGTVGKLLKRKPRGRFIVGVRGHVFTVIDGRPFDVVPVRLRARVKYIVEVVS